jgi:hypothetical protein
MIASPGRPELNMLFEIEPDDVSRLGSADLVQLMKLLLLNEARNADVPLRAAVVPMQITVADGGEDGRVEWTGGATSTDYFPVRFNIFQSKAQNVTETTLRNEIVKKKRVKGKLKKTLSPALLEIVAKRGAYIVFSSKPFSTQKKKKLQEAARKAIREAGKNPARLAAVEIYDANTIADWVNTHPSAALWMASRDRRRSLTGFQTHEQWGKAAEMRTGPWRSGGAPRFVGVNEKGEQGETQNRLWTFDQAAAEILSRLSNDQQSVRIAGPSGFGKSRFLFEVFNQQGLIGNDIDRASVIYADHAIVGDEISKLALEIADSGAATILVVDECPDDMHLKLASACHRQDSKLRLVSLDVETRVLLAKNTLAIRLEPAPGELISEIAKGVAPKLSDSDTRLIQELSHGFPQMAVLAAQLNANGPRTIRSVDQLLNRIIWGRKPPNADAQKALEVLSLFEWVGLSGRVKEQSAIVAAELAGLSDDAFTEHIKSFKARGIVVQRGDFVQVEPLPLAVRLATHRWEMMPDGKLLKFFQSAPRALQDSILRRIRWLDEASGAVTFTLALLQPDAFGNFKSLNTDFGAKVLDRLVHVDPDAAMVTINRIFGGLSIDEVATVRDGRRYLVWALEKLVFRKSTFRQAARLLRRLGATETEERISNNASGQFKQLYQLYLSGTEASPDEKLLVLDEGLTSTDANERAWSFEALSRMLDSGQFSRTGGSEDVGSRSGLKDWQPSTYGEGWDFHRAAISRLTAMALDHDEPFSSRAKSTLGSHIRGLLTALPFEDVKDFIDRIVANDGFWPHAVQELNEWLFFNGKDAPPALTKDVRALYDRLLPTDPVELAYMYTHGWQTDFHDPDVPYDPDSTTDFEYSTRMSVQQAELISANPSLLSRALDTFAVSDTRTMFAFARRLAELSTDPIALFSRAVAIAEGSDKNPNLQLFGGMIAGIDALDPSKARECIRTALRSQKLKPNAVSMIGSGKLQAADLKLVASLLRSGDIQPAECAPLSYGRGLDHLAPKDFMPLLDELTHHGPSGLWTVLDILSMYLHGGRVPDATITGKLKEVLLAPELLQAINHRTMDGHHLEEAVSRLAKGGAINRPFASALAKQLLSICHSRDHDLFFELDDYLRKCLQLLLKTNPGEVWTHMSALLLSKDWLVRERVKKLIEFRQDDNLGAGLLFNLPESLYLEWVRRNPEKRAAIAIEWLPIAIKAGDDKLAWHPALEAFVIEFGRAKGVMAQVSIRMHPHVWWGSIAPRLEPLLSLLATWDNHRIPEIRLWAEQYKERLKKEIADAKHRSEEDPIHFN